MNWNELAMGKDKIKGACSGEKDI